MFEKEVELMTEGKKKGILSKLFGAKQSSCCCNVQIEEVTEEEEKGAEDKSRTQQAASCCGPRPTGKA